MMEAKRIADEIELTDEAEENLGRSQNEAIPMDQQVPRALSPTTSLIGKRYKKTEQLHHGYQGIRYRWRIQDGTTQAQKEITSTVQA